MITDVKSREAKKKQHACMHVFVRPLQRVIYKHSSYKLIIKCTISINLLSKLSYAIITKIIALYNLRMISIFYKWL